MAKRRDLDPYTKDGGDPLELLCRMSGRTSYRVPGEGRGSAPLMMASEVAGAVGFMTDPLARATVISVASRAEPAEIARLSRLAWRRAWKLLRSQRPSPLDLRVPADRWRLRIVIYDAAYELVWPERRRSFGELALEARMRKGTYIAVHKCATSVLQEALNEGRRDFAARLFSE